MLCLGDLFIGPGLILGREGRATWRVIVDPLLVFPSFVGSLKDHLEIHRRIGIIVSERNTDPGKSIANPSCVEVKDVARSASVIDGNQRVERWLTFSNPGGHGQDMLAGS